MKFKYGTEQKADLQAAPKSAVHVTVWRTKVEVGFKNLPSLRVNLSSAAVERGVVWQKNLAKCLIRLWKKKPNLSSIQIICMSRFLVVLNLT